MATILGKIFGSPIFTWWISPTFGTRLFTKRKGVQVGEDDQGNVYYQEKDGKRRWVIYKNGPIEASRVPPEWHGWLHYTVDVSPVDQAPEVKSWEKDHVPNMTGTMAAYMPEGAKGGQRTKTASDYEAWRP